MQNWSAEFVPFSPLSSSEIVSISCLDNNYYYLFIFYQENKSLSLCWHAVVWDMIFAWVYITHANRSDQAWHLLSSQTILNQPKYSWMCQNAFCLWTLDLLKVEEAMWTVLRKQSFPNFKHNNWIFYLFEVLKIKAH